MDAKEIEKEKHIMLSPDDISLNIQPEDDKLRRKLVDEFVENSEKMKVFLRIRASQLNEKNENCIKIINNNTVEMHPPKSSTICKTYNQDSSKLCQQFIFTKVCGPDVGQKEFFDITMRSTVKQFIEGQNCLVFAYGITNSGKSYTIQGKYSEPGLIPQTLNIIFNDIQGMQIKYPLIKPMYFNDVVLLAEKQQKEEITKKELLGFDDNTEDTDDDSEYMFGKANSLASSDSSIDTIGNNTCLSKVQEDLQNEESSSHQKKTFYSVWVSFVEVYNEHVFDLLLPLTNRYRNKLNLAQDKNGNTYVKGLSEIYVTSAKEAYEILKLGQKNLRIASTKLNHQSSRSHCIFNIKMVKVDDLENPETATINKLSFCDLAGSERTSKTQNKGERLKEASNINTSLLVLGRCIETLRQNQIHKEKKVIPYRDSKLTRIFQSIFTGKGVAVMIVNVHQCFSMFDETLNVMKFSAIAKQIMTTDVINTSTLSNRIMDRLTEIWARSSESWSTFSKRTTTTKSSLLSSDETMDDEEENGDDKNQEIYDQLVNLVKDLEKQLIEAKKENALMESQIRYEVAKEYSQHMMEMEKAYNEQLKACQENAEDLMEKRIELLHQMYNNSDESEDNEEEEETELNEKEEEKMENLNEDNEGKTSENLPTQIECIDETNNKDVLKLKEEIKNLENELDKQGKDKDNVILKLNEDMKKLEIQLAEKIKEIDEQANIIIKSGEVFCSKEYEVIQLNSEIKSKNEKLHLQETEILKLSEEMKKYQSLLETTTAKINKKETENRQLQEELKAAKESQYCSTPRKQEKNNVVINELQVKLEEISKEKLELQNNFDNLHKEFVECRLNNMKENAEIKLSSVQNLNAYTEMKEKYIKKDAELEELNNKYEKSEKVIEENRLIIQTLENELEKYKSKILENEAIEENVKILGTEAERYQYILSEAATQLKLMLYSDEDNVISLMKEMHTKWNDVNNLIVFLEKELYFLIENFNENKYDSQIKLLTEENEKLKNENMLNNEKLQNIPSEEFVEETQKQILDLKNKVEEYIKKNNLLKDQINAFSELEVSIKKKDESYNNILYEFQIIKCKYEESCNKNKEIEEKLKFYEEKNNKENNTLCNFGEINEEYNVIKETLQKKENEIKKLESTMQEIVNKNNEQTEQLITSISKLEENLKQKENECNDLLNELQTTTAKFTQNQEVENPHVIYSGEREISDKELNSVNDSDEKSEWEKKFQDIYGKYKSVKKLLKKKTSALDALKSKLSSSEELAEENNQAKELLISRLENDIKQKEDECKNNLKKLEIMKNELEDKNKHIEKLQNEKKLLQEIVQENDHLKTQILNQDNKHAEMIENLNKEIKEHIDELQQCHDEIEVERLKISSFEEKYKRCEEERKSLLEKILHLENNNKQKDYENLNAELEDAKMKLKQSYAEIKRLQYERDDCFKEKEILNENIKQLSQQVDEYKESERINMLKHNEEREKLKEEINSIQREAHCDKDKLEKELNLINEERKKLKYENEKLKEEMEEYKNKNNMLQMDIQEEKLEETQSDTNREKVENERSVRQTRLKKKKLTEEFDYGSESSFNQNKNVSERVLRTRSKKGILIDISTSEDESFKVPARKQRQKRQSNKRRNDENEPSQASIKQVQTEASTFKKLSSYINEKSPVLGAVTQSIMNIFSGSGEEIESIQGQSVSQRKKRRQLFLASDQQMCAISPVEADTKESDSLHTTVTRQLRTRNRRKNYA